MLSASRVSDTNQNKMDETKIVVPADEVAVVTTAPVLHEDKKEEVVETTPEVAAEEPVVEIVEEPPQA